MSTLVVDRISKSFGDIEALKRVSFECKEGEFVVIVGPSGAGKSTTLNCISGVELPEEGTIFIGDKEVTMMPARDRNVAMVFETYALYPQFSVYNNLAFPLRSPRYQLPEDEIEARIKRVSTLLSIDMLLDRLPRQLSQGQRQRVSLGRALVRTPDLFLLDEPISHLDAKLRNAMRRELKLMRASLTQTTVYVTHDYLEALSLADRVVVLFKGEVLQFDRVKNVYNRPAAVEVGNLFGDLPMMFFEGKVNEQNEFIPADDSFRLSTEGTISQLQPGLEVILGLRPTDVQLTAPGQSQIKGEVYSVQNQFDRQLVTIKSNGNLIDLVAPSKLSISAGDKAGVSIAPEICYYFDRHTHKAL
ncbi:MAG TPA: ABC transporter ATP-binding protein [Anaerolineales bacterium]